MRLQGLYLSILGLFVVANVSWSASDPNSRIKLNGAEVLMDGSVHATGAVRADRYFEVINVSTPSTPPALHSRVFLSSESICAVFDNSSTACFGAGSAAGTITGVTAGTGLNGGGTTGNVTLNITNPISNSLVDSSSVTKQGNVFNGNSQLVQTNSSGQIADSVLSSNVDLLASTQTISAAKVFSSSVTLNKALMANGSAGTSGQVLQSNGANAAPTWTTASAPASGSFTPSVVGMGTISNAHGFYQQIGNMVHVWGDFESGTTSGSTFSMAVPVGSITYANRAATDGSAFCGWMHLMFGSRSIASANLGIAFLDGSDTANVYFTASAPATGSAVWPKSTGSSWNSTTYFSFDFWYAAT